LSREDVGFDFLPCRFGILALAMLLVQLADLLAGVGAGPKWRGAGGSLGLVTCLSPEAIEK
jgi:hypothetical protein